MKGDFTRDTFDSKKHFKRVLMQQGRVQLDADWNEQLDITAHRVETETADVIGACGTPLADPGFAITIDPKAAADFLIGPGRYYVDGILCENEVFVAYTKQPDWLGAAPLKDKSWYLVYLDVWERHLTALDDDALREKALGGPDTATRAKTIWQAKLLSVPNDTVCSKISKWDETIAASTGRMSARGEPEPPSKEDCEVAPGAGYRRLENQLYRVEIHDGGDKKNATFKWSRENGSLARKWMSKNGDVLTISSPGRDANLGFAPGQWIELNDDARELRGEPGTLVKLIKAEGVLLTIDLSTKTGTVTLADFPNNPKVRRWEGDGPRKVNVKDTPDDYIKLEDGVQIKFEAGTYRAGDYWLIPARTAIGDFMGGVEWVRDPLPPNNPLALSPRGIAHHYCKLAIISFDGKAITLEHDCRPKFPALDALTCFYYVGGDGQEATPAQLKVPQPLRVGVSNGNKPVGSANVRFTKTIGNGTLTTTGKTGSDGIATCEWTLENNLAVASQQVQAELLDDVGSRVHLPIFFNAKLEPPPTTASDSCCVCIGPDGDFKTLEEAIFELAGKRGLKDLCLCFMPGDHIVKWLEELRPMLANANLKMTGCGRGARLHLEAAMWFHEMRSLLIRDLTIEAEQAPMAMLIEYTRQVTIENCDVLMTKTEPAAIVINTVARFHFADNVIRARDGVALLLADGNGECSLENNLFAGALQLYGGNPITPESVLPDLEKIRGMVLQGAFPLQGKGGTLRLNGNRVRHISVSGALLKELAGGRKDPPLFAQSFYTNNRFESLGNMMLAEHTAFAENAFEPDKGIAAASISYSAVYVGNRGGDPTFKSLIVGDFSVICDEAANIMLRVPICIKRRTGIADDGLAPLLGLRVKPKRVRKPRRATPLPS